MPESLKNLTESLKYMPGVGEKTAERYAFAIMNLPEERIQFIIDSIRDVHDKIHPCPNCYNLTEDEVCSICSDKIRDNKILCVVEDVKNLLQFEKIGVYKGLYHVLDGLISPLDGIYPEDISLDKLLNRIKEGNFKEIILAFKPSVEGDATALYINKILNNMNVVVSRIASGIPIGADIEYMDAITLERAFSDRKNLE